jgi:hypothetical protein
VKGASTRVAPRRERCQNPSSARTPSFDTLQGAGGEPDADGDKAADRVGDKVAHRLNVLLGLLGSNDEGRVDAAVNVPHRFDDVEEVVDDHDFVACLPARLGGGETGRRCCAAVLEDEHEGVEAGPRHGSESTPRTGALASPRLRRCLPSPSRRSLSPVQADPPEPGIAQFVMVTGTPGPMRIMSQRIVPLSRRTQPWETELPRTPPMFASPWRAIWPGPPSNLVVVVLYLLLKRRRR